MQNHFNKHNHKKLQPTTATTKKSKDKTISPHPNTKQNKLKKETSMFFLNFLKHVDRFLTLSPSSTTEEHMSAKRKIIGNYQ